jgi:hypothetical protein
MSDLAIRIRRLEAAFAKFHAENPHIYELFKRFTADVIRAGFQNFSARAVFHRIRWYTNVETNDPNFKINNNHSPYYARMWMIDHDRKGFFRTRELLNNFVEVDADEYEIRETNGAGSRPEAGAGAYPAKRRWVRPKTGGQVRRGDIGPPAAH